MGEILIWIESNFIIFSEFHITFLILAGCAPIPGYGYVQFRKNMILWEKSSLEGLQKLTDILYCKHYIMQLGLFSYLPMYLNYVNKKYK